MERRLVRQGRNAITMTLPAVWVKSHGLKAGDAVQVEPKNTELVITTSRTAPSSAATIDGSSLEESMVWHVLNGKYIEGYDTITILHPPASLPQKVSGHLLGMIVEEQTPSKVVIKSIIVVPEDNFEALFRRIMHMFVRQSALLIDLTERKVSLDGIKEQERLLDANVYYALRFLSKYENHAHAYRFFLLCSIIEEAADQLSSIAKFIGKDRRLAMDIHRHVEVYSKCLFSKDLLLLYTSLRSFRNAHKSKSFVDGLVYSFADCLYNNIGYLLAVD